MEVLKNKKVFFFSESEKYHPQVCHIHLFSLLAYLSSFNHLFLSQDSPPFFRYQLLTGMFFHHFSHCFKVYWPQHRLMDGQPQSRHEGGCEWGIIELGHREREYNRKNSFDLQGYYNMPHEIPVQEQPRTAGCNVHTSQRAVFSSQQFHHKEETGAGQGSTFACPISSLLPLSKLLLAGFNL